MLISYSFLLYLITVLCIEDDSLRCKIINPHAVRLLIFML